jgi:hypothetical protein
MEIAREFLAVAAVLTAAPGLIGCMIIDTRPPIAVTPLAPQAAAAAPQGIEGEWVSTDGVAVTQFSEGAFQTVALDTGKKLADGSYRMVGAQAAEIRMRSLIRQTRSNINCALVSVEQLNCTASGGRQFVLMRRPMVS